MSQFTQGKNMFPDHYLSHLTWKGVILYTIVVQDPGVVVARGGGGVFVLLGHVYFTQMLISTKGCVITLP